MGTNGTKKTVVVAMSGGVDSSVAAALLLEQGYNVIGVTMKTYDFDDVGGNVENETSCCGLGAMHDAHLVASTLGIPHYVVDFRKEFGSEVIDNFVQEYFRGRTPNPCVICNREIKWGALLRKAEALGADCIATGHYARVRFDRGRNRYVVVAGLDRNKDQSYALWALSQQALSKTLFPLGEMTKSEVRARAARYGLRTATKDESFEICFVADHDVERFLKERNPEMAGRIREGTILRNGSPVGSHRGYAFYTVGQRRGLGAYGQPMYVTRIDSEANTITIGTGADLLKRELHARSINLMASDRLEGPIHVTAKVRYKDEPTAAVVRQLETDLLHVSFLEPKRAITPGQSLVLYDGDTLLGGGIIDKVLG